MTEQNEFVLVPRKPTKAMLKAAAKALSPERRPTKDWMSVSEKHAVRYEAMIAAAECATEDCDKPGTERFEAGGIGSTYCGDCGAKVQALRSPPAEMEAVAWWSFRTLPSSPETSELYDGSDVVVAVIPTKQAMAIVGAVNTLLAAGTGRAI